VLLGFSALVLLDGGNPVVAQQLAEGAAPDTSPASDDATAKSLFEAGKAAYAAGKYEEALQRFQDAYQHSKRPELLYNVGVAADRLRYNHAALEAFKAYVRELPTADNRVEVENRIRALEAVMEREKAALSPATAGAPRSSSSVDASLGVIVTARKTDSIFGKWWFWTAAGGVLAAAIVGVVVATSGDKAGKPTPGTDGVVVLTLSRQ
jgi:hypothetical protein